MPGSDVEMDEFASEEVCPMCGELTEHLYEIEPGLEPVCASCAADYELDKSPEEASIHEAEFKPTEQNEPGMRNHPSDCDCRSCVPPEQKQVCEDGFAKFMDRLTIDENRRGLPVLNDSPHRKRAMREQERPLGRVRIGSK